MANQWIGDAASGKCPQGNIAITVTDPDTAVINSGSSDAMPKVSAPINELLIPVCPTTTSVTCKVSIALPTVIN